MESVANVANEKPGTQDASALFDEVGTRSNAVSRNRDVPMTYRGFGQSPVSCSVALGRSGVARGPYRRRTSDTGSMKRDSQHGGALLVTLILISSLMAGASVMVSMQLTSNRTTELLSTRLSAGYCAESGL